MGRREKERGLLPPWGRFHGNSGGHPRQKESVPTGSRLEGRREGREGERTIVRAALPDARASRSHDARRRGGGQQWAGGRRTPV